MNFLNSLTIPAVGWMLDLEKQKDLATVKRCIGNSNVIREMIAAGYKHIENEKPLSLLPYETKLELWNESLTYCPDDRMEWCEALHFYTQIK
jgi:hypothetical protein